MGSSGHKTKAIWWLSTCAAFLESQRHKIEEELRSVQDEIRQVEKKVEESSGDRQLMLMHMEKAKQLRDKELLLMEKELSLNCEFLSAMSTDHYYIPSTLLSMAESEKTASHQPFSVHFSHMTCQIKWLAITAAQKHCLLPFLINWLSMHMCMIVNTSFPINTHMFDDLFRVGGNGHYQESIIRKRESVELCICLCKRVADN